VSDSELAAIERRVLTVLNDVKGQLTGVGNQQIELGRKLNDLLVLLKTLVSEWQEYRKEVELAQAKREVEAIAAHYSKTPKKAPRKRKTAAGSPPKKTRKKARR
jgi:hypothetical protein